MLSTLVIAALLTGAPAEGKGSLSSLSPAFDPTLTFRFPQPKPEGPAAHGMYRALAKLPVKAAFQFRWVPSQRMVDLLWALSTGITRILQCAEQEDLQLLVLAHSAGGVLASFAASRISVPATKARARIEVMTISSPLGGLVSRDRYAELDNPTYLEELGTSLEEYPTPALGVHVTHVRTLAPGDGVMTAAPDGHRPNNPKSLVPTARVVTLAADVSHTGALDVVAEHLAAGDFEAWSAPLEGLGPDAP